MNNQRKIEKATIIKNGNLNLEQIISGTPDINKEKYLMEKHCKECPWIIRNNNNDIILNFVKKTGKPHNCHMTKKGREILWSVANEEFMCLGSKLNMLICNTKVSH